MNFFGLKLKIYAAVSLISVFVFSFSAYATLLDIGTASYGGNNYNLIYDDNPSGSVVWLDYTSPANTWANQVAWASSLNNSGVLTYNFLTGYSMIWTGGWQLPTTVDEPSSFGAPVPANTSQMAYLYYQQLANTLGNPTNFAPFENIVLNGQQSAYWSGTEVSSSPGSAWIFGLNHGSQHTDGENDNLYALANCPGQLLYDGAPVGAVPEPSTMMLLGLGVAGLAVYGKRRANKA